VSTVAAWKCLSVASFLDSCNWQGLPPKLEIDSLNRLNESLEFWQCFSSQKFFSLNNWNGEVLLVNSSEDAISSGDVTETIDFSLTLPTAKFWQFFAWSGRVGLSPEVIVADAPKSINHLPPSTKELTLQDLSQLF